MNKKTIYLTTSLVLATASFSTFDLSADTATPNGVQLRYGDAVGSASLSVNQDITAGGNESIAGRDFQLDFELSATSDAVTYNISKAKGSYTAHGMTQRLSSSGLKGQALLLSKVENGAALERTGADDKVAIGLGPMVGANYPVGLALVDILPVLPAAPVEVGTSWTSTQQTQSLEGWSWASGRLTTEHNVTAVDELGGHIVVSVSSTATAQVADVEGAVEYSGDGILERTSHWRFDVTDGKLLSVSMEQNTTGQNTLPQGTMEVKQVTKVEYLAL